MIYPEKVGCRPDRIAAVRHPEKVGCRPDRIEAVRHPDKVELWPGRIPNIRHPGGVSDDFRPGGMSYATRRKGAVCVAKGEKATWHFLGRIPQYLKLKSPGSIFPVESNLIIRVHISLSSQIHPPRQTSILRAFFKVYVLIMVSD